MVTTLKIAHRKGFSLSAGYCSITTQRPKPGILSGQVTKAALVIEFLENVGKTLGCLVWFMWVAFGLWLSYAIWAFLGPYRLFCLSGYSFRHLCED